MTSFTSFEELECWKACREVVKWTREMTKKIPRTEFNLIDNITRAARSTTRNVAEGFGRFSFQENTQFCRIARGSLFEVIDDIITLKDENYISADEYKDGRIKVDYAIKVLNGYIHYLQTRKKSKT